MQIEKWIKMTVKLDHPKVLGRFVKEFQIKMKRGHSNRTLSKMSGIYSVECKTLAFDFRENKKRRRRSENFTRLGSFD